LGNYVPYERYSNKVVGNTQRTLPSQQPYENPYISYNSNQSMGGGAKNSTNCWDNNNENFAEIRELFLGKETTTTLGENAAIATYYRDLRTNTRSKSAQQINIMEKQTEASTATNDNQPLLDVINNIEEELFSLDTEMEMETEEWLNSEERELLLFGEHVNSDPPMEIISREIPAEIFKKPIIKVASKEEMIKNLKINTGEGERYADSQSNSHELGGTDPAGETVKHSGNTTPALSATVEIQSSTSVQPSNVLIDTVNKQANSNTVSLDCALEIEPQGIDQTSHTQDELGCRVGADIDMPVTGAKEPGELTSSSEDKNSTAKVHRVRAYRHRTSDTAWVTAETVEQIKKALGSDTRGYFCNICEWRGSRKRTRVHIKQHFTVYLCPCGLAKVSRDSIYDHQMSKTKLREGGHGSNPGNIFEVDNESYVTFRSHHPTIGPQEFPRLPPTHSGRTQGRKKGRNYQREGRVRAQAMDSHSSRWSPIRNPSPAITPVLRIRPVSLSTADTAQRQTNRLQRELTSRREGHAARCLQEARCCEQEATAAIQASLRHPETSPTYRQYQQKARRYTEEAKRYKDAATFLQGNN
jgi:hypothetical protein